MVRGYHVCKDIWDAVVGQEFPCRRKDGNRVDHLAVAAVKAGCEGRLQRYRHRPRSEEDRVHMLSLPMPRWIHRLPHDRFQMVLHRFSSMETGNTVRTKISRSR